MFDNIINFFKKFSKKEETKESSNTAKERLHLVLMQDRANVSADFLELMRQEIIEVIKKYIDIDEDAIDVKLTNKTNEDGTVGAPALYANIPIITIKNEARKVNAEQEEKPKQDKKETAPKQEENEKQEKEEVKSESAEKKEEKQKNKKAENKEESKEDVKEEQEEKEKAQEEKETKQETKKQIKKETKQTEKQVAKK